MHKSKVILSIVSITMLGSFNTAKADDYHRTPYVNNYYHYVPPYRPPYYPYNYYYKNNKNHSSDDAAWAIGGLVVGAIIGASANQQQVNKQQQQQKPATAQVVRLCTETVKTDSRGNTVTERTCRDELIQ